MASMSWEASGLRFTLSVGSLEAETFVVAGFTLHEQLSTPFMLELEVVRANPSIEFGAMLDRTATLTICMAMIRALNKMTRAGMPESIRIA